MKDKPGKPRTSEVKAKQALALLTDSETRYRRLFETAQDGILILDARTGRITDVNPFLEAMLGYSHQELLGKRLWQIGPFKDVPESRRAFKELQKKRFIRYEDLPLETKSGKSIQVEFVSNVYTVDHTKVIQCNIRDITERKHLELQAQSIIRTAMDGFLIMDVQGHVLNVNNAYCKMTGYRRGELLKMSLQDVEVEEKPGEIARHIRKLISAGQPDQTGSHERFETRHRRKDGTIIDIEFSANYTGIGGGRFFIFLRDITAHKNAEKELASLSKFPGENPLPVLRIDANGILLYANKSSGALTQYWRWQTGKPVSAEWLHLITGALQAGANREMEMSVNDWIYLFILTPVAAAGYVNVYGRDITARKRAEDAIVHSEEKFRTIFDAVPSTIVILDEQLLVKTVNGASRTTFGIAETAIINHRWGDALRCVHAEGTPQGCGHSEFCAACQVRNTTRAALSGIAANRARTNFEFHIDGQTHQRLFSISAAPIEYELKKMAVLTVEDITELSYLRQRLRVEHSFAGIQGKDEKIVALFDAIRELAESNAPVLIQGESGTGKELVASAIHNEGPRRNMRFVAVNCGALPDGLLESELFGHSRGAFTGAVRDKKGRFELADGGTIFLDEVGDLSPAMQVKLMRVLQNGTFEPIGSEKTVKVNVRVISATNKDLHQEITAGRFREDLFYRLCVVPLTMPPLRERIYDLPLLADNFLEWFAKESQRQKASLSPGALDVLMQYRWPGNVRELQNALQFALIKSRGAAIAPHHLPISLTPADRRPLVRRHRKRKLDARAVDDALRQTAGNKLKAAKLLGVGRATLHRFLAEK